MPEEPKEPIVVGTTDEGVFERAAERAPFYTEQWDPRSDDEGTALLELFSELAADVASRIDRAPEKHRRVFFDTLGFSRDPPQPAQVPLAFTVAEKAAENVAIPAGTRALAEATADRPEQTFEILSEGGFEATPARLKSVYSIDPDADLIVDHTDSLAAGAPTPLFDGVNAQWHAFYLGHPSLLDVAPGAVVRIVIEPESTATALSELVWEYYGTGAANATPSLERDGREKQSVEEDNETEGWYRLKAEQHETEVRLTIPATELVKLVETTVDNRESRWLRCRTPTDGELRNGEARTPPPNTFNVSLSTVRIRIGRNTETPVSPDALFHNDVPIPVESDDALLPLGNVPRPRDAFYVASNEAFSKGGATAVLNFHPFSNTDGGSNDEPKIPPEKPPRLSWEYWNGEGWERLDPLIDETANLTEAGEVRFAVPTDLEPSGHAGVEAHWIRVRLVEEYASIRYETREHEETGETEVTGRFIDVDPPQFNQLNIEYGTESAKSSRPLSPVEGTPDHLLTDNNLAYVDRRSSGFGSSFRPFERPPDATQTLYLGFDGPLRDGPINLFVSVADAAYPETFYPRIRWEYQPSSSVDSWETPDVHDGTESLTERGIVGLVFPTATIASERFGQVRHWIRARVNGEAFRTTRADAPTGDTIRIDDIDAERERVVIENTADRPIDLSGYRIDFEHSGARGQVRTFPPGTVVDSGESLVVATGTKSLGYADVRFDFRRWVLNNTDPDMVAIVTPDKRQVITSVIDHLDPSSDPSTSGTTDESDADCRCSDSAAAPPSTMPAPCNEQLSTDPPAGGPTRGPPTLLGLYPNTDWAASERTVTDELLGSSDGSPSQTFAFSASPITDSTLWVDELTTRSATERDALLASNRGNVEPVRSSGGDLSAFWVRWRQVSDFAESGPNDRHYTLDATAGWVTFGDGVRGAIPPRGDDNVRASYGTGGGLAGNIAADTATRLVSSIPFVDEVTNPEAADGGSDAETTASVLVRAPEQIRHRGRAVTTSDFERIALDSSRKLARVRCLPLMDAAGDRRLGWATLLIVPNDRGSKPLPSETLTERVFEALRERAPAVLVDRETPRLVVRGPSYVETDVGTTLRASGAESVSTLEEAVTDALVTFLHPLSGGIVGTGWEFGELPCLSDFYALLEGLDGVDHVQSLSVTFTGSEESIKLTEGAETPNVARDVLVCSGTHDVQVVGSDTVETPGGVR
ncbi:putative baseplate assembly protein [Halalkalicoccus salilacus]|uniref:putative baseplate assembly protein n=1 Tax=Halalkalicoccus salilacus TaxID=3117459 RepID=UPI00300F235A